MGLLGLALLGAAGLPGLRPSPTTPVATVAAQPSPGTAASPGSAAPTAPGPAAAPSLSPSPSAAPSLSPSPSAEPSPSPSAAVSPSAPPRPSVPNPAGLLYRVRGDFDGDGQVETACVVRLDGGREPNSRADKVLRIYSEQGRLQYATEPFQEPFQTDLDYLAEGASQRAGLHILNDSPRPRLRLIFATRSGNFYDFEYDGKTLIGVGEGD